MKVLFIADPMASFKTYKDTTYAMMREMAKRGWRLFHTLSGELSVNGGLVTAQASAFEFSGAKTMMTMNGLKRRTKFRQH